jgi:Na+/melibiose symporter-like transporter
VTVLTFSDQDLRVSLSTVDLTITSYLIIQGISPVIWGSFSDALGRRPIYIASFATYIVANIALSFSPNFAVLLIFRGLQSAGSASTVSIGTSCGKVEHDRPLTGRRKRCDPGYLPAGGTRGLHQLLSSQCVNPCCLR